MAIRFYIVPAIGDGLTPATVIRPRYIHGQGLVGRWMPFGLDGSYLCGVDVTPAQHNTISSQPDVLTIPQNLDATISGVALNAVKAGLESVKVPAEWVTTAMTYRQVLGFVGRVCLFLQRFRGMHRRKLHEAGITLDTTLGELTVAQRDAIRAVAEDFGLDYSGATLATTIRQMFRAVATQLPSFTLMGEVF